MLGVLGGDSTNPSRECDWTRLEVPEISAPSKWRRLLVTHSGSELAVRNLLAGSASVYLGVADVAHSDKVVRHVISSLSSRLHVVKLQPRARVVAA